MMDQHQQRDSQNQQQQQRSHHRRPPDVEEALSSMLWTPYERTPTDSSSDDDDERLNRKLRKSQSSYEYYQYGGLTLAPPAAIMPYFGSNDPITPSPIVPLSNQHDSVRNHNNINNNNNSILSYSGSSNSINNNCGTNGADYFRKTDRCDNFRFSYPYYGPIPSLKKCLSVEPPSYDSLYSKSRDATRVLSSLVTVSATAASGLLRPAYTSHMGEVEETYGRMVHSFTDNFVIECNSLSSPSASSSGSSTISVHRNPQQQDQSEFNIAASNNAASDFSITINDITGKSNDNHRDDDYDDEEHKADGEQKQTEVSQLFASATTTTITTTETPTKTSLMNSNINNQQQHQPHNSTTLQQRKSGNGRIEDRSRTSEPNEVSSLSAFVVSSLSSLASRSVSVPVSGTQTTTATTATATNSCLEEGFNDDDAIINCRDALLTVNNPREDNEIIVGCNRVRGPRPRPRDFSSSGSAEEFAVVAMRLNIPATVINAVSASPNDETAIGGCSGGGKNVFVTTSSVFLTNSVVTSSPRNSSINHISSYNETHNNSINNNNNSSVAILSNSSAPSLTIQVNDSCSNISNGHMPRGDFVVNQSIANNGISVVNCTYVNSGGDVGASGSGSGSSISNSSSSSSCSSVPKNDKFFVVNSNQTDIQSSTAQTNGLQQLPSPARTFTSTECQTDDIPIVIRDDGPPCSPSSIIGGSGGGSGSGSGSNAAVRNHLHPDALLSREQRRRERRERRHHQQQQQHQHQQHQQQQQQHQQQMQHQRLSRHHSHSHPPPQPQLLHHPAHHTMSAAAAAMLRPMLPDILHSHFPPPYSALPLSQGAPPPPPPPHAASLITPVISTVPIAATATMVGDGRFTIPLPIIRRSPSERSGKGCCGQWFAGPPLRALIAVVALGGVACALGGAALGATGLAGPPSSHLTAALLMIGVGVVLVTVSGAAWRMTAPGGPPCLGLGSSVDLGRCGRRPCSRGGGAPHGLLYPEFQHRPPPPSYQASMQEYRLRLLLLDRDRQNGVVRGSSPPPTYRSHAGSLLRAPLTTTIRAGASSIGGPGSEYSLPPSYRSRNTTPAILPSERSIETAPSGRLLANEDIPESSLCTISSNFDSSLPAYNAIISDDLHQQQSQQNPSSRNPQPMSAPDNDNRSQQQQHHQKDNITTSNKMGPQRQITSSTLCGGHQSSSTSKEHSSSSGDRASLSFHNGSGSSDNTYPREQLLHLSEKLNPRVLANSTSPSNLCGGGNGDSTRNDFFNIHTSAAQTSDTVTTGKTKDLVTIVTISAQDSTNQLHMQPDPPSQPNEMEILAHL